MVVMALGTSPNPLIKEGSALSISDAGLIEVNESQTNLNGVYAGGDAVTGAATVILAYEAGKKAARKIIDDTSI